VNLPKPYPNDCEGTMSEKLLPCPFCGGEAEIERLEDPTIWFVDCSQCKCQLDETYETKEDVIEAWNTRRSLSVTKIAKLLTAYLSDYSSNKFAEEIVSADKRGELDEKD